MRRLIIPPPKLHRFNLARLPPPSRPSCPNVSADCNPPTLVRIRNSIVNRSLHFEHRFTKRSIFNACAPNIFKSVAFRLSLIRWIREEERTAGLLFLSCFFFPFLFSHRRVQIKFLPRVEKYPISNLFRLMNFAALKRLLVYSFACSAFCRSWNEGGGERERGRKGKTDWIYQRNKQVSVNDRYVRTWEKSVGRSRTESRDFSLEYWFWRKRIEIFVRFLPFLLRSNS